MILVRNLRQQLNGNKYLIFFLVIILFSCRSRKFEAEQAQLESEFTKQLEEEIKISSDKVASSRDSLDRIFPLTGKASYRITYFFPFSFEGIYEEDYKPNVREKATLDFYMGARLALLSMEDSTVSIDAVFINTNAWDFSDSVDLEVPEIANSDLIIGPFEENEVARVSELAMHAQVNMISPFIYCHDCLLENPYFFSFKPSRTEYIEHMMTFLHNNYRDHHINLIVEDKKAGNYYINESVKIVDTAEFPSFRYHVINNANWNSVSLSARLPKTKNIILMFMEDEFVINSVITNLVQSKKEKILIAPMLWLDKKTINLDYLHRLNTYYVTDFHYSFQDSIVKSFAQKYRGAYQTEPGKYAYSGYKATRFAINNLVKNGVYFQREKEGLICINTGVAFRKKDGFRGFECCEIEIWEFDEYEFKKVPLVLPIENEEDEEEVEK